MGVIYSGQFAPLSILLFLTTAVGLNSLLASTAVNPAVQQAAAAEKPEAVSLLGAKLYAQPDKEGAVAAARQKLEGDPRNIDNLVALGRAQAAIWRFQDAIDTYTQALKLAAENAVLYRHRGHRYISTRQFRKAESDLQKAAELNNKDFDIWYHLGLAYYLQGNFASAARAYESCLKVVEELTQSDKSRTDDSLVAVSDWLYITYRRSNRDADAARVLERITPQMNVKENRAYYNRLLMYKGLKTEEELLNMENANDLQVATLGYGVGNWHLYNGRKEKALEIFRRIVSGKYWPAFGFIAAEAELVREK